jgi:hypothetical protein
MSRNILLLLFTMIFHQLPAGHDITVKLKVHGTDDRMTEKIWSNLKTDLGNKSNIVMVSDTTDSATFNITVQYSTLKSGDKLVGIFLNSILSRRIRTSKDETAYILLKSSVSSTSNPSDIEKICSNWIDQYEMQYFDKERKQSSR